MVAIIEEIWDKYDTNGNGYLSRDEFKEYTKETTGEEGDIAE